jgi:hypothetical protein
LPFDDAPTAGLRGQGPAKRSGNACDVDEQGTEGTTSTRCRFCGCDDGDHSAQEMREKSHIQVVVACGSCGHAFTALSRN